MIWTIRTGALLLVVGASVLLNATRDDNSATYDESNHLATGLEWWQYGSYTWWTENPPLARMAVAAGPFFSGLRLPPRAHWDPYTHPFAEAWTIGVETLHSGAGYERNLRLARLGTLPFYTGSGPGP